MKNVLILTVFFSVCSLRGVAQNVKLSIGSRQFSPGKKPVVQLKFRFDSTIASPYTINVFRKKMPAGTWFKINSAPITKRPVIPVAQVPSSSNNAFKLYQGYMNHVPDSNIKKEAITRSMANFWLVSSNAFALYAGTYFEDGTAKDSATYQYRITDALQGDKELAISSPFLVKVDYLPVISDLVATQEAEYVHFNWNEQEQFYGYKLYRKTDLSAQPVTLTAIPVILRELSGDTTKDNSLKFKYSDTADLTGQTVFYQIAGVDELGNEAALSKEVAIEIKDMVPPPPVTNLIAEKKDSGARLTWQPVTNKDCIGYNVYRGSTTDTLYTKINTTLLPVNTNSFIEKRLGQGTTYAYYIESIDSAANIAKSPTAKVFFPDQTPPAQPRGVKATSTPGIMQITWAKNMEPDFMGYLIYRSNTRDKHYFNLLNRIPFKENRFTDTLSGVAKNEFVYYLVAVDSQFNKSPASDTLFTLLPDTLAPHAPYLARAENIANKIVLGWSKQFDDDVTGFNIFRSGDTSANRVFTKINRLPVTSQTYSDYGIKVNRAYYYYVTAVDNAGNASPHSNIRTLYTEIDTALLKPATSVQAVYNTADSMVHIQWYDSTANLHGYVVYRKERSEERFSPVSSLVKQTAFIDSKFTPGKFYQYLIRSYYENVNSYKTSAVASVLTQ